MSNVLCTITNGDSGDWRYNVKSGMGCVDWELGLVEYTVPNKEWGFG